MRTIIIRTMKPQLKALALQIRELKATRKQHAFGAVPGLKDAQVTYRYMHICYCLLRGRTIGQIEPKNREDNKRSGYHFDKAWKQWVGTVYPALPEVADEAPLCARA